MLIEHARSHLIRRSKLDRLFISHTTRSVFVDRCCKVVHRVGRWVQRNHSVLLKSLFLIWILSPFLALIRVYSISGHWSAIRRGLLYNLMLFVAFVSMVAYSGEWNLPGMKPAFLFLVVPLFCWALMIVAYFIVNYKKRKA